MPVISFMPYFPDRQVNETFGDFTIWNWQNYKTRYITDLATLRYLDAYFHIFRRPDNKPEDRIAVVSTTPDGILSEEPEALKWKIGRFAAAAMLAHLAQLPADRNAGMFASSSDNFLALMQPFNLSSTAIALQFGSYFRADWAASGFERLHFITPQYVPDPGAGLRDDELWGYLAILCSMDSDEIRRVFRALDWVRFAFTNFTEHPYEARIISMATAYEILLDMPEEQKAEHFSKLLNGLLPQNRLPVSRKLVDRGKKGKKVIDDNAVGWWCRHFYELRSRIIHGDKVQLLECFTDGADDLKVALDLFVECIWGLRGKLGIVTEIDDLGFWIRREKWINALKLPRDAFY